jgi:DNA mismatch endonuclease, patch repair protein
MLHRKSRNASPRLGLTERMARISKVDTKPELMIRKALFSSGFRYRLHRRDLPGNPDIVFPSRKKVVLVHGCFWHRHDCLAGRKLPTSKPEYWVPKLARNKVRDADDAARLKELGWSSMTVWECELSRLSEVQARLVRFLKGAG